VTVAATPARAHRHAQVSAQWAWIAGGLVFSFLVPFVFADRLGLQRDLFYGIYVALLAAFLEAWLLASRMPLRELLARNWLRGILLGLVFAGVMTAVVLKTENAASHPGGLDFVGALLWRGVVYGIADGLLLSVFPILAVFAAFEDSHLRRRWPGKAAIGALALVVSLGVTASFHLGYSDFRSQKVKKPLIGDVIWSAPTLLTLSPLGAPIAHIGLHVAAVIHSYDTNVFLPPHAKEVRTR
jgi:hypothetical protein